MMNNTQKVFYFFEKQLTFKPLHNLHLKRKMLNVRKQIVKKRKGEGFHEHCEQSVTKGKSQKTALRGDSLYDVGFFHDGNVELYVYTQYCK